ncbi:MAG TPA: DUF4956 domain-containing protein [Lachnospiraceae bacterium]|nr:DUF4956 domain-containing protein [Lachnospiraceae bacterium]
MSVEDFIKKSILESDAYNQTISLSTLVTIFIDLAFALIMGILIYAVYKKYFAGVVYSRNYALTLIGMSVLTAMVTLAISTNIVISLGMVGALSIVRFRTAIKEPLDLMYMFWAITMGITAGASMYLLAIVAFVIMFIMVIIFSKNAGGKNTYILVVHFSGENTESEIAHVLSGMKYAIRSKVLRGETNEMTIQLRAKHGNLAFADKIKEIETVKDVVLLAFDGEYHG